MARTPSEAHAVSRANTVLEAEVDRSGGQTFRVVVDHDASDHDVLPVAAHYGPAFNAGYAQTAAEILGVPASDVDLLEHARQAADRARQEYPRSGGYVVAIETLVTEGEGDDAVGKWRRVE